MRTTRLATRSVRLLAATVLQAAVAAGVAPAPSVAAARTRPAGPEASFAISGGLAGVAATSATSAWAVGGSGGKTLIVHWNGRTWTRVPSPAPAGGVLYGIAATSASNAWAVGCTRCFTSSSEILIVRWNGKTWTRVPSPAPAGSGLSRRGSDLRP